MRRSSGPDPGESVASSHQGVGTSDSLLTDEK